MDRAKTRADRAEPARSDAFSRTLPWAEWLDPAIVVLLKLAATTVVTSAGFVAISDDDFARLVIAQRFIDAPRLDPSQTSWLPLPFWLYGAVMALFGRSLAVAQVAAAVFGALSAAFVHRAARWLGIGRAAALLGASLAALFPHALWLGAAPIPETLSASLSLLALASLGSDLRRRGLGAIGLLAATLCRYETWPIAAFFAMACVLDARRTGGRRRALSGITAMIALLGPLAWMLHGLVRHNDALFFLKRVAAYRDALGDRSSPLEALAALWRVVQGEPELALVLLVFVLFAFRRGTTEWLSKYRRPAIGIGFLLAFLAIGEALGGAPTHHPGRPLLAVWYLMALALGDALFASIRSGRPLLSDPLKAAVLAAFAVGMAVRIVSPRDSFAPRRAERAIGQLAKERLPEDATLLIDTADYGYFAVMASFGHPERAAPLVNRDPRRASVHHPLASFSDLARALRRAGANYIVLREAHAPLGRRLGQPIGRRGPFELYHITFGR